MLVTGHQCAWKHKEEDVRRLAQWDASGMSLGEFRLARDYAYFPLSAPGYLRSAEIARITHSREMKAYWIDSLYNVPIARRIAEEAGVPREAFGQRKSAPTLQVHRNPALLSPGTQAELAAFAAAGRRSLKCRMGYVAALLRFWARYAIFRAYRLGQRAQALRIELARDGDGRLRLRRKPANIDHFSRYAHHATAAIRRLTGHEFSVIEHTHPRATLWLRWGHKRMKGRYAPAGRREDRSAGTAASG